jgi:NADPH-dependent 2,4-dienoyl-CoA reductase/sulfur reductase-like enzyme
VLRPGSRLVIVGAGFVGCEVAATALGMGVEVSLVDPAPTPLFRALGGTVGRIIGDRLLRAGVDLRVGTGARRREVGALRLSDGSTIDCDAVLVGVGIEPSGELMGRGWIPTDSCGRTGIAGVYACGDVADWDGRRHAHWTSAVGQGGAVAEAILGTPRPYSAPSFVWSDTAGLRLQLVGSPDGAVTVALDGDEDDFSARYMDRAGHTVSILLVNRPQDVAAARHELAAAA